MFFDKIYNNKIFFYFLIAITIFISPLSADEETLAILEKLKKVWEGSCQNKHKSS